jgi:hypothetical protein
MGPLLYSRRNLRASGALQASLSAAEGVINIIFPTFRSSHRQEQHLPHSTVLKGQVAIGSLLFGNTTKLEEVIREVVRTLLTSEEIL